MPMSPEARARLVARNQATQVWKLARNTGPKTDDGKKRIAKNALKHGARSAEMGAISAWIQTLPQLCQLLDRSLTK